MTVFDRLGFDEGLEESPRVKDSRISVIQVYEMHVLRGLTVTEIAEKFEALDEEDVNQAIRYSITHPDFVREQATSPLTIEIAERQSQSREPTSA
jgi:uncharacterized protein (DUF433 family)